VRPSLLFPVPHFQPADSHISPRLGTWPYVYDTCDVSTVFFLVFVRRCRRFRRFFPLTRFLSQVGTLKNQTDPDTGLPTFDEDEGDIYNNGSSHSPFFLDETHLSSVPQAISTTFSASTCPPVRYTPFSVSPIQANLNLLTFSALHPFFSQVLAAQTLLTPVPNTATVLTKVVALPRSTCSKRQSTLLPAPVPSPSQLKCVF
jgi:hypothetical protein